MHEVNHIVPGQLVNRLRLKNLQKSMEQLVETEMHQPSQCSGCENKRAQLAEDAFLRRKRTILEGVLLQEKLKDHLCTQDALLIIGKMHQRLPKLSDDPRDIWRKLKERALQAEGMALPEPSPKQKKHISSRAPALSHGE
uniref:Uncharacterized protein n=2 Tax=Sphaerodactylus townsendi TaxID=933632 RepID=A0ACB8FY39_9SAUR